MSTPFEEMAREQPTEELLTMVLEQRADYTKAALDVAEAELLARGVDPGEVQANRVAAAADERVRVDLVESEDRAFLEAITHAGSEDGLCLACRRRAPELERRLLASRPGDPSASLGGDLVLVNTHLVPLSVRLCGRCAPDHPLRRPPGWIGWLLLPVGLVIGLGLGVLVLSGVAGGTDNSWARLLLAVFAAGGVGVASLPWMIYRREARRVARLHPYHDELLKQGFTVRPDEGEPTTTPAAMARSLQSTDRQERELAEASLRHFNTSENIRALRALIAHEQAGVHAIRILTALRAVDAIPDLEQLSREGAPDHAHEAEAALTALRGGPRGDAREG